MEELSPVHRYAAGALFSLALNQAQIHRLGPVPELQQSEEDGPKYPVLSEDEGNVPWGSESCGLLRHVLRYLNIDPQAWPGIEITAALPDAKHHIGPSRGSTFGFSSDTSGSRDFPTEQELLSSLSRLGLSPRLSGWTKKILSTFSTLGLPLQFSAPATKVIELGVQSTLKTFELPQFTFSRAEMHSLLSTLGLSPRPSLSTSRHTVFNPSLPTQRKRQLTLTTHGLPPSSTISTAYPTGEDVQSIISAIGLSQEQRTITYPTIKFQRSALSEEKEKFIRILQEDKADTGLPSSTSPSRESSDSSTKPEKSIATLSKAIDAMALSLEEFAEARPSAKEKTFEETFADHVAAAESEQPSTSGSDSGERVTSMTEPLLGQQRSDSQAPTGSAERGFSMKEPLLGQQGSDSQSPTGSVEKTQADVLTEDEGKEATEHRTLLRQRKVAVLYEVLTACVADTAEEKAGKSVLRAGYDARQRAAIRLLALWLDIEWKTVAAIELMVAYMAMAAEREREAEKNSHSGEKEKQGWAKWKRGGIIGAAALTGGVLLAVTGGLAAPAIAAGLGALAPVLGIGGLATVVGSAAGSVAVAASFGAAGAGLAGTKMARRTGGVDEFMFLPIGNNHQQGRLAVGIMVSGIVFEGEDFTRPWEGPDWDLERYALRWETKELMAVSTAIEDWLASNAAQQLFKAGAMMTVLAGLVAALAWPATLLAATDFIDGKWSIAIDRSDKAGIVLAKCLLKGTQGNRPVTLIGFSLGARVIFSCLEYLAKKGDGGSIVERVVLLGAPITLDKQKWKTVRKVVAGRFINAYSTNDWILGVIYRASFVTQGLAGLSKVDIPGIENIDVTEVVNGHSMYLSKTSEVLAALDIDNFYPLYPSKVHAAAPLALETPSEFNLVPETGGHAASLALEAPREPNRVPETSDHAAPVALEAQSESN